MPAIGVVPPEGLKLVKKSPIALFEQPYYSHSAAAAARVIDLNPGDKVISATNPITKTVHSPRCRTAPTGPSLRCVSRMRKLVGKPMKISVLRKGATEAKEITVAVGGFDFEDAVYGTTDPEDAERAFQRHAAGRGAATAGWPHRERRS